MQDLKKRLYGGLATVALIATIVTGCVAPAPAAAPAAAPASDAAAAPAGDVTLTIATVNNPDMKVMQELSPKFTEATGIKLDWVVDDYTLPRERAALLMGMVADTGICQVSNTDFTAYCTMPRAVLAPYARAGAER